MPTPWLTIDPQRAADALGLVVVLGGLLERALAPFFESGTLSRAFDKAGSKQLVALVAGVSLAWTIGFDATAMARGTAPLPAGMAATGLMLSLGARGAAAMFVGLLGIRSGYLDQQLGSGAQKGLAWPAGTKGSVVETTKAGVKSWRFTLKHSA